ncbi:hypothetical protein QJV03_08130 [Listeria swaminathanii]|uniref:Uncharacterized protein n=2 Tax=Listeria swaminathanii TaxID=2713501 RepID=A0ABU2IHI8_9LIST|nr:hypothetical protein [Listeria swaminathanii]UHP12936.1 hypothetical protein LAX74_014175 [Listeria marthii]MDT0017146.1 hypothetical protein [Listeria swaminathanii]MDT0023100.1 hypothetical protein [Listeria swaminathanii]MDT0034042.1 hypothetical protein [Listeria swaminathanii]MDT0055630.1 hypothetical protein [Listeria swaminathanii]
MEQEMELTVLRMLLYMKKYKDVLGTTEKANPLVDSLRETGKLPDNFISKCLAIEKRWRPGTIL